MREKPVIVYTDFDGDDAGLINDSDVDIEIGEENSLQIVTTPERNYLSAGCKVYVPGTEYGGIIDAVQVDTKNAKLKYTGRTFRGILSSYIVCPASGNGYVNYTNVTLYYAFTALLTRFQLNLFVPESTDVMTETTVTVNFRYCTLLEALEQICALTGNVLKVHTYNGYQVSIQAAPATDYSDTDEFDGSSVKFTAEKVFNSPNHIIALGKGELSERMTVDLYADENGVISDEQTIFGLDQIDYKYENTEADTLAELITAATKKFRSLIAEKSMTVSVPDEFTFALGDLIQGKDFITGLTAKAEITSIIYSWSDDQVKIQYKTNTNSLTSGFTKKQTEELNAIKSQIGYAKLDSNVVFTKLPLDRPLGDINNDGSVNSTDYGLLNRYLHIVTELDKIQLYYSDLNGDGIVNNSDYSMIQDIIFHRGGTGFYFDADYYSIPHPTGYQYFSDLRIDPVTTSDNVLVTVLTGEANISKLSTQVDIPCNGRIRVYSNEPITFGMALRVDIGENGSGKGKLINPW